MLYLGVEGLQYKLLESVAEEKNTLKPMYTINKRAVIIKSFQSRMQPDPNNTQHIPPCINPHFLLMSFLILVINACTLERTCTVCPVSLCNLKVAYYFSSQMSFTAPSEVRENLAHTRKIKSTLSSKRHK